MLDYLTEQALTIAEKERNKRLELINTKLGKFGSAASIFNSATSQFNGLPASAANYQALNNRAMFGTAAQQIGSAFGPLGSVIGTSVNLGMQATEGMNNLLTGLTGNNFGLYGDALSRNNSLNDRYLLSKFQTGLNNFIDSVPFIGGIASSISGKTDDYTMSNDLAISSSYSGLRNQAQQAESYAGTRNIFKNRTNELIRNAKRDNDYFDIMARDSNESRQIGMIGSPLFGTQYRNVTQGGAKVLQANKKGGELPSKSQILKAKQTAKKLKEQKKKSIPELQEVVKDFNTFMNYLKETGRDSNDYDYNEFFKDKDSLNQWLNEEYASYQKNNRPGGHFTDKYKLPSHPTFSEESIYSKEGQRGGRWQGNIFYASPFNRTLHTDEEIKEYFAKNEPGVILMWEVPNELREEPITKIFKEGGKLKEYEVSETPNLIPEGALHARLHHIENAEGLTKKGIPVVAEEGGKMELQAEIERNEIVFNKEVTEKLEHLYKIYNSDSYSQKEKDEAALEAGKMLSVEIVENTEDRTGLMLQVEE